jgi:hypothetical protein
VELTTRLVQLDGQSKHPERFEEDGSRRMIRFFDSSKATLKGTLADGAPLATDSRQVRRRKIRLLFFNRLTVNPVYGSAPRFLRRFWAKKARLTHGE